MPDRSPPTLDALARPSGTFAMVAMDQRESLRTMLREHGHDSTDERVARFKEAVARELARHASGFLIEPDHLDTVAAHVPHGLILAVDVLDQQEGAAVEDTSLAELDSLPAGVVALKLLVIWRDDERRAERIELSRGFADLAARHGVLSVLEPVVRHEDREWAIVEAARELGDTGCSLYKCQVPLEGKAEPVEITRAARAIDEALPCPWVVLSQGVAAEDFPAAVEASCRGGASGFLAGRALWTATLGADDPAELLRSVSVPRLRELGEIVDAHGRPWRESC
jgi:sulfofructosephosphate aldolase